MNERPLKVCLLAPHPPPYGGIANWTVLTRRYAQSRKDVILYCVDTSTRWRAIDDLALWKRTLGGGLQLIRDYVRFLNVLRAQPDVIHLTTSGQLAAFRDILILATARIMSIPTVYHLRFGRTPQIASENSFEWRMMAKTLRMAHTVIAIDPATAETVQRRVQGARIVRVPNGVDMYALPQRQPRSSVPTILYLGWIVPAKGIEELVQAWKALAAEGWRCLVVGPGSDVYRRNLIKDYRPVNLEFLPEQSHEEAMRLLAAADVLVLPSYSEGFPNVIVEAMALGKPIVATGVGAVPEMLAGECGLVVPPRDGDALREALSHIMSDSALQASMGERAQRKAQAEYAMDKVFEQCVSVWRKAAYSYRSPKP